MPHRFAESAKHCAIKTNKRTIRKIVRNGEFERQSRSSQDDPINAKANHQSQSPKPLPTANPNPSIPKRVHRLPCPLPAIVFTQVESFSIRHNQGKRKTEIP
jgi:hypothetical protein